MDGSFLQQAAVFLAAAAIAAPVGRWLKLGSVIGYLAAGILIGPYGLHYVSSVYDVESVRNIAELGVALLLFVIGLELRPVRIWAMRRSVFGAGGAQLILTALALACIGMLDGLGTMAAVVIGLGLAMSSTAFVLQGLEERQELTLRHGRMAFSITLMQDLVAIPLLAIIPLLGTHHVSSTTEILIDIGRALGIIAAILLVGRWLLNLIYYLVAKSGVREALTATGLLIVVGVALLMQAAGLSPALGAFIAGVLLADSAYRHQIEADVAPFEGLLLGLFFTAVGMSLNLNLLERELPLILALAIGLLIVKAIVLYGVGLWHSLDRRGARRLAVYASQGGEFAFVVFSLAAGAAVIGQELAERLAVVVTLTMAATPLLLLGEGWITRLFRAPEPSYEVPPARDRHVVIAGFGRFGQIIARVLRAKRIPFTALDISPDQIKLVQRYGNNQAHYGDASRLDILEAANVGKARAFVLAIDDMDASLKTAAVVRSKFPNVPIYARARNRQHVFRLMDFGITEIRRETFLSAIELTRDVLRGLGLKEPEVRRIIDAFITSDRKRLFEGYEDSSDIEKLQLQARQAAAELETILAEDEEAMRNEPQ